MRAIVQKVSSASVTVGAEVVSNITEGFMVLVGLGVDDTPEDVETIAQKILNLKAFPDSKTGNQWKETVRDRGGEILCVSQFTLFAKIIKNKPDFHKAMPGETSRSMYASFLERMGSLYDPAKIKDGRFGAMMSVGLTNEGPVTFTLDSRPYEYISATATPTGASRSGSSTPVEVPKASRQSTSAKSTAAAAVAQRNAEKALRKAAWDAKKRQGGGSSASNEAKSVEDIGEGNNDTVVEQVIKASTV